MVISALLYLGLALGLVGAISLIRPLRLLYLPTRRRAAAVSGLGVLLIAVAALAPAPDHGIETPATRLDEFIPVWQFAERHEIRIRAEPAHVEEAVRRVTAREIRFFLPLTWLRRPRIGTSPKGDILSPPADRPILDVALSTTFFLLAEEPGREIVFGTLVSRPRELRRPAPGTLKGQRANWPPERFRDLSEPGYAKAVMNFFLVDEADGWTRLVTETRVFATDRATTRRFAVYWRLIYPGSSLIRRTWLAAIRDRAEGGG